MNRTVLLQLSIDVPETLDDAPQVRAEALARMGGVLADLCQSGVLGDIRTMDLSKVGEEIESETETARGEYGAGYSDGFTNGYRLGASTRTDAPAPQVTPAPAGEPDPDTELAAALARYPGDPILHADPIAVPLSTAQLPARVPPEDFPAHTVIGPLLFDDPAQPGAQITVADAVRRANAHQAAVVAAQPAGPRPAPGPGAPISAYDQIAGQTAAERYGFPALPFTGEHHIDTEGASWRYQSAEYSWIRCSYPTAWGEPTGSSLTVTLPAEDYTGANGLLNGNADRLANWP